MLEGLSLPYIKFDFYNIAISKKIAITMPNYSLIFKITVSNKRNYNVNILPNYNLKLLSMNIKEQHN